MDDDTTTNEQDSNPSNISEQVLSTITTEAEEVVSKATTQAKTEAKRKRQEEWIKKQKMEHIIFNDEMSTIVSIAGVELSNILSSCLKSFARANNVQIPATHTKKNQYIECIIAHHKNSSLRNKISSAIDKESISSKTKTKRPPAASSDNSIYRAILTITHSDNRTLYLNTLSQLSRQELDSTKEKSEWKVLTDFYNSNDEYLNTVTDNETGDYTFYNNHILPDPSDFDRLNTTDFQSLVGFINKQYKIARQNKNKSGQNAPFANFINKRGWLLFYHEMLCEIGDKDLCSAAYSELDDSVFFVSTTSSSMPPRSSPTFSTSSSTKQSFKTTVEIDTVRVANIDASNAFVQSMKRERLQNLQLECIELKRKRTSLMGDIEKKKKSKGNVEVVKQLKEEKYDLKKILRHTEQEIEMLKKDLNVTDIEVSDSDSDKD